jgi:hypothetical protein
MSPPTQPLSCSLSWEYPAPNEPICVMFWESDRQAVERTNITDAPTARVAGTSIVLPVTGRAYPTDRLFVRFPVNWVPVSSELHDPNRLRFTPWFAFASFAIGDVADAKLYV